MKKRNPRIQINNSHSLHFAFEIFSTDLNIHKIPIIDRVSGKFLNLITQKQIIDLMYESRNEIGTIMQKKLSSCSGLLKYVYCINESDDVIKGFELMVENNIGGVAVVYKNQEITGALSLSDLKLISTDDKMFQKLFRNASSYLEELDSKYYDRAYGIKTVNLSNTLEDVLTKLFTCNLHRVFIVDSLKRPIGVVGIKDILKEIL